MKIERTDNLKDFSDIEVGEFFRAEGGTGVYLCIEVDGDYIRSHGHSGLGVNLETGTVTCFDDTDKVIVFPNAKVIW